MVRGVQSLFDYRPTVFGNPASPGLLSLRHLRGWYPPLSRLSLDGGEIRSNGFRCHMVKDGH